MERKYEEYNRCTLCPRKCNINRNDGEIGFCRATNRVRYALANLHMYEEPCISGETGSGTIFFCGCNLRCIFCQNYKISQEKNQDNNVSNNNNDNNDNDNASYNKEKIYHSVEDLAEDMIRLQGMGANNINLVTGFMYIPQIIDAIIIAKSKGLSIPILYNSSGYESVDSLKKLEGYIDVYLPDLKYIDEKISLNFSIAKDYFSNASSAIVEMYRQVGAPRFDKNGMIQKGLIIRHLVIPNNTNNTREVLKWIKTNIDSEVYVSIMAQYFPTNDIVSLEKYGINRKLSAEEYEEVEDLVFEYDFNGFIQDLEDDEAKYVPDF